MATDFSRTLEEGHEAVYDYCCTTCARESLNAEAIFYCKDCSKLLCNTCEKNHSKFIQGHHVLGKKDVDKWGDVTPVKAAVMCDDHPGKEVEMYCLDHGCVYCHICINISHRSCKEVKHVSDVAKGIRQNQQFKTFPERVNKSVQQLQTKREQRVNNLALLQDNRQKIKITFQTLIERFNWVVNMLEKRSMAEMENRLVALEKEVRSDADTCSDILDKIQRLNSDIETVGKDCDTFTFEAFKKCESLLSRADETLLSMLEENYQLLFAPDQKIDQFLSSLTLLGEFKTIPDSLADSSIQTTKDQSTTSLDHVYSVVSNASYNIKTSNDKKKCNISGMSQLPGGNVVIVDQWNEKVKLLDTATYSVVDELQMPSYPIDICQTSGTEFAVTVSRYEESKWIGKGIIHFITVEDCKLIRLRTVELDHECKGIANHDGQLYVNSKNALYVYTLSGEMIKQFYEDTTSVDSTVNRFSARQDGSRIYITNFIKDLLVTLDSSGNQLYTFSDPELKQPRDVCVADDGSVFVGGQGSDTILQIDREGRNKIKTLATEDDSVRRPLSLLYNNKTQRLLVGQLANDILLRLQLK